MKKAYNQCIVVCIIEIPNLLLQKIVTIIELGTEANGTKTVNLAVDRGPGMPPSLHNGPRCRVRGFWWGTRRQVRHSMGEIHDSKGPTIPVIGRACHAISS